MAAVMPATTPTTTTVPLPNYQVSGAGVAAAAPRHGASGSGSGSVGAFFGVLAAVLVLTVLSCVFGWVCAAQAEGADESYDCRLALWRRRSSQRRRPVETKQTAVPPEPLPLPLPEP